MEIRQVETVPFYRNPSNVQRETYLECLFGNGIFLQAGDHFQHCHHVMDLQQGRQSHFMFHVQFFVIKGNLGPHIF